MRSQALLLFFHHSRSLRNFHHSLMLFSGFPLFYRFLSRVQFSFTIRCYHVFVRVHCYIAALLPISFDFIRFLFFLSPPVMFCEEIFVWRFSTLVEFFKKIDRPTEWSS